MKHEVLSGETGVALCREKTQKGAGHIRELVKTRTPFFFWNEMVNYGPPKRSENGHFSRRIVFFFFFTFLLGFVDVFLHEVLYQTPKKALFYRRSYSKGPSHALEKVLTTVTPDIWVARDSTCVGSSRPAHMKCSCGRRRSTS